MSRKLRPLVPAKMPSLAATMRCLAIVSLALTGGAAPTAATPPQATALVAIYWQGADDLAAVEAAAVPVYARLTGADGRSYLLAGASDAGLDALQRQGLEVTVLDPDVGGAGFLLAYVMPGQGAPAWPACGRLLLDDGQRVLLRATPGGVQCLAGLGVHVQALSLEPKPLLPAGEGSTPASVAPHPRVWEIMDQVRRNTVYQYTGDLSGEWPAQVGSQLYTIQTRHTYSGTPIQKATQYAGEHLAAQGLDVEYHTWQAGRPPNVIGELTSHTNPDEILIICGHLDDMPSGSLAPGADDNASGSVAVLLAAELLSRYPWTCSLRFALWTGEEQGLLGSASYAQRAYALGEEILGVLNLDMIAWNTAGSQPGIDLHADQVGVPTSMQLAQLFSDVVTAYGLDLDPQIVPNGTGASDHASFWDFGYPAILGIEDFSDFNPYYHTTDDLLAHTDLSYYTEFVRASLATLAHMGCLATGAVQGHVTDAYTDLPLAATVILTGTMGGTYQVEADATGYYEQPVEPDTYTVRAAMPGYLPSMVGGVAVGSGAVVQDLALDADTVLQVAPEALAATLVAGETATQTLRIGNAGSGSLRFALHEVSGLDYDVPWLAETPSSGLVAPGEAMTVSVTFDAAGLAADTYRAGLEVTSNDPIAPHLQLPVTLTVGACQPVTVLEVVATPVEDGTCAVAFAATLAGAAPFAYHWDLGTAGHWTMAAPVVDFGVSGSYPYTLTVSNCGGVHSDEASGTVMVQCQPPWYYYLPVIVRQG